jgi:hypothetical protein
MKLSFAIPGLFLLGLLAVAAPQANSQQAKAGSSVEVRVNYTGPGTVDAKHQIYVVLWDSPDFITGGAMPIEILPVSAKDGKVTFTGVKANPAYFSAAYDPTGQWDGASGPPPSGSALGLYMKEPGKPEPVKPEAGKTVSVELAFDDSIKMP